MKKASFILGLIGGIFGIILCLLLTISGLMMKVTNPYANGVIIWGVLGLLASIAGLVGACIVNSKSILAGILMIIGCIINLLAAFAGIGADSLINFTGGIVTFILLLIAGIFAFIKK